MGRGAYYRYNARRTTADYLSIKVADINRKKGFSPGWYTWHWSRNGERIGSVALVVTDDTITFRYSTKDHCENPLDISKPIRLAWTPCNYGGRRTWFVCGCGRRVARLFIYRQHVACRHCFNLAYPTQNGDECDRAWARIYKLEGKLKDERYRPKGMHWRTFQRIKEKLTEAYYQKDFAFVEIARRRFPGMEL